MLRFATAFASLSRQGALFEFFCRERQFASGHCFTLTSRGLQTEAERLTVGAVHHGECDGRDEHDDDDDDAPHDAPCDVSSATIETKQPSTRHTRCRTSYEWSKWVSGTQTATSFS